MYIIWPWRHITFNGNKVIVVKTEGDARCISIEFQLNKNKSKWWQTFNAKKTKREKQSKSNFIFNLDSNL